MNLLKYWQGAYRFLKGDQTAIADFDLGPGHLAKSFIAIAFALPVMSLPAFSAARQSRIETGRDILQLPMLALAFIMAALTFPFFAWLIALIYGRKAHLRDWIIARNWSWLLMLILAVIPFAAYLIGAMPYVPAVFVSMLLYFVMIFMDYRIARSVPGLTMGVAIIAASIFACAFFWTIVSAGLYLSQMGATPAG